jgi:Asp-tRNA(Asn)/Glu-tRNA(Gln) amidotransferase B subunit
MWFLDEFDVIVKKHMNINATDEQIKQLSDRYEGDYNGLYVVAALCLDMPPEAHQDLIQIKLDMDKPNRFIRTFVEKCRENNISGSQKKQLIEQWKTIPIDQLDFTPIKATDFTETIKNIIAQNQDAVNKATDKTKMANFLFGQIMKTITDKKSVDMASLKKQIESLL